MLPPLGVRGGEGDQGDVCGDLGLVEVRADSVSARAKVANYCLWGVSGSSRKWGQNKGERVAELLGETGRDEGRG